MAISRARCAIAGELRPVITPVRIPMMLASLIPAPSWALNTFISATLPSGNAWRQTVPGVRVPSASIRNSRTLRARRITAGGNFVSRMGTERSDQEVGSEELQSPQVVDVQNAFELSVRIHD